MLAALRVIDRGGVSGATTRAIVSEAGMALASFHYAFRSRDELISAVIAHVIAEEDEHAFAAMREAPAEGDATPGIRDLVRAGLEGYFSHLSARPGHEQAVFELFHYALRTPGMERLAASQYESYRAFAGRLLALAAERAAVRWALPLDELARLAVAFVDGFSLSWLADRDAEAASRMIDAAADMIAAFAHPLDPAGLPAGAPASASQERFPPHDIVDR